MAIEAEAEEAAAPPGKKSRLKLIIIAGAAVTVLLIGAAAYFFLFSSKPAETEAMAAEAPHSFIFNLPAMTVNLNSEDGQESFMKLSIALEVADQAMMETIQPRMAKVVDAFQVYLRELRKSDLEGSAGIYRLKEELLRRVNIAIAPAVVDSILFKEILVQ